MAYKLRLNEIDKAYFGKGKADKKTLELVNKRIENLTENELDNLPAGGHIANCDVYALVDLVKNQVVKENK